MASAPARPLPATWREALPVFFAHGSPRVLLGALGLALAARVAVGGVSAADLAPPAVLLALWPLQEWAIHVLVLHWRPRRLGPWTLDFRVPQKHRAHHADPSDLAARLHPVPLVRLHAPAHGGALPRPRAHLALALTSLAAYLALALHYEWIHFLVHTRVWPRTALYQRLWRNHRLHHFKNEHYWFGVTRRGGDRSFARRPTPARWRPRPRPASSTATPVSPAT